MVLKFDVINGIQLKKIPNHYSVFASTEDVEVAGYTVDGEQTFGVQFHPEVYHSTEGKTLLKNSIVDICGCTDINLGQSF